VTARPAASGAGTVPGRPGPGRIRRRNRTRILGAAEEVFAEKGFDGATTAEIAERAGLPKANVHYYFGTKEAIYRAVIDGIMELWLEAFGEIDERDDPAEALARYIRAKVSYSRNRPLASRIFANEIIRGAPVLRDFLQGELRAWVDERARVLRRWAELGKMDPVDPAHLFFLIWAATQTYADFEVQVRDVLGRERLRGEDYDAAADFITRIVLKGCGVKGA